MYFIAVLIVIYVSFCTCDTNINQIASDGSIAQIDYARNAIARTTPIFGFSLPKNRKLSLLLTLSPSNNLIIQDTRKLELIDRKVGIIATGYDPDVQSLWREINSLTQEYHMLYSDSPTIDYYGYKLSSWMTRGLYPDNNDENETPLSRPIAASTIFSSYDFSTETCKLLQIDSSGAVFEGICCATGTAASFVDEMFEIICKSESSTLTHALTRLIPRICEKFNDESSRFECIVITSEGVFSTSDLKPGTHTLSAKDILEYVSSIESKLRNDMKLERN